MRLFVSFMLSLLIAATICQPSNNHNCSHQTTCRDCLSQSYLCNWCIQPLSKGSKKCAAKEETAKNCAAEDIVEAENTFRIEKDAEFSSQADNVVQLKPQLIRIRMGKNQAISVPIGFQPADNFPVDLYFVMDTSSTMKKTRTQLAKLMQSITTKIGTLTQDYQLGFGSFVDKPIEPFTNTHPEVIQKPCTDCIPAYGFRNHLNLSTDVSQFKSMMEAMETSGNIDEPEGGFDAIVQAVVCKDIIGWRQTSRKLLFFFTDGPYHSAGDGKLAGILEANDLKCHLDQQGYYSMSTQLDYPSVSQLARVLLENKVSLIIGTSENLMSTYSRLSQHIESSYVGEFGDDSTLENIVFQNYEAIQQSVNLKLSGFDKSAFEISVRSKCHGKEEETSRCDGVKIGRNITFHVSMKAVKCFEGLQRVRIHPVGIEESLVLEVEVACRCPCAQNAETSAVCSNNGKLVCGVCECQRGHYGEGCSCEGSEDDEFFYCKNLGSSLVCSGQGECVCSKCQCGQGLGDKEQVIQYQGEFCQCSNDTCRFENGPVCSDRGLCECGSCKCEAGFIGDNCQCSLDTSNCTASNGEICNDKGHCECGKCVCDKDVSFKGPTCEDCPTCQSKCQSLVNCVSCRIDDNHPLDCAKQCGAHDDDLASDAFKLMEELPEADPAAGEEWCVQKDAASCVVTFVYKSRAKAVLALKIKECPEKPDLVLIIGTTFGGVLLMGIVALVVWKVVVTVYDRNEYLAFEKAEKATKWSSDDNPLYKTAITNFQNPTFTSKKI